MPTTGANVINFWGCGMIYLYKCSYCLHEVKIEKSMANSDRIEHCEICEGELKRVYESPSIATADGIKG